MRLTVRLRFTLICLLGSLTLPMAFLARAEPLATGRGGAIATVSPQATAAGLQILDAGGNAIDAAIAAAATLGVTDPFSCGIGGGGFMVIYLARERRVVTIDHRETAPASVTPDVFRPDGHELSFEDAAGSGLSVGVPGTVRGWELALDRYGSMKLDRVLQPAIAVAEGGFEVSAQFSRFIDYNSAKFRRFAGATALYLRDGRPLPPGAHFANPGMAKAYREIAAGGGDAFYAGPIAEAIVSAVRVPAVAAGAAPVRGGSLSLADLADYQARLRAPVHATYRGYDIYGMGPPSSGGIALAEALNMLEGYELREMPRPAALHLYLEASRLAFADRDAYLADPEFVDAPAEGLLSKTYAAERRRAIDRRRAAGVVQAGNPYRYESDPSTPLRPAAHADDHPSTTNLFGRLASPSLESTHTTHLAVADSAGNVVAYTFTIEDWGGSGIVAGDYGFLLNNELTDFSFSPPHPNAPEARKRPRSSMTPTIALKQGRPAFTIGAPGGSTIITTVLQTVVNYVDLGKSFENALAAPRLSQRNRDVTTVESGFEGSADARALEAYGHKWELAEFGEISYANALFFADDGTVTAISEPSRGGGGSALVQHPAAP
jgi:gamma-glutamyltranspeptidase/glutathione hydrolase